MSRFTFFLLLLLPALLCSAEYHVAKNGADTNDGSLEAPWLSIAHGLVQLRAGDTLYLHKGKYRSAKPLTLPKGGEAGKPVTIRNYQGALVKISKSLSGSSNGLSLLKNDYIIIDGIDFEGNGKSAVISWGSHLTVRNCVFHHSNWGIKNNAQDRRRHHLLIENCTFYSFADLAVVPQYMDNVVIRNCYFFHSRRFGCINPNNISNLVIENCYFVNPYSQGPMKLEAAAVSLKAHDRNSFNNLNGAIIRRNIFLEGAAYTLALTSAHGAVVYNNVIGNTTHGSSRKGLLFLGRTLNHLDKSQFFPNARNVFKNNIFYLVGGDGEDTSGRGNPLVGIDLTMGIVKKGEYRYSATTVHADYTSQEFDHNLYYKTDGDIYVHFIDKRIHKKDVRSWGNDFDIHSVTDKAPRFIDPRIGAGPAGFMVHSSSPVIDAGSALTYAITDGEGMIVVVNDARYFSDGCGLVAGDEIQIGRQVRVRVISRNLQHNTITLDKQISWKKNDPVTLLYSGSAPDIGAFEFGMHIEIGQAAGSEKAVK